MIATLVTLLSLTAIAALMLARTAGFEPRGFHRTPGGYVHCGSCGQRLGYVGLDPNPADVFACGTNHRCPGSGVS